MRGTALSFPTKIKFKQIYPLAKSWGTVSTTTPKKLENKESQGGTISPAEKTEQPLVAFSKPPPLPPFLGPLVALSLLETLYSRDGDEK